LNLRKKTRKKGTGKFFQIKLVVDILFFLSYYSCVEYQNAPSSCKANAFAKDPGILTLTA
ncbi:MAG: hypothetical protein KAW12_29210, partial [Candidatus Aminicenantes bacterium]|nr:hypothetical protein [Candidatus Aminicenantes bacterium]